MLGRTDSRRRLIILVAALVVVAGALTARLAWWQIVRGADMAVLAHRQTHLRMEVEDGRGTIYDRSGTVVLATTVDRARVIAAADRLDHEARARDALVLARILGLEQVARVELEAKLGSGRAYVVLARDVDPDTSELIRAAIRDGSLSGISLEVESKRVYPQAGGAPGTSLAAHLLGFANRDGAGQYGVEQFYDDQLSGTPTVLEAEKDSNGRAIPDTQRVVSPGIPGADMRLTIDTGLQLLIEQEVLAAWIADKPRAVSAVVMDPNTGEVYASATFPSYDANSFSAMASEDPLRFVDPIVSEVYEPGSVFKMVTVVAGLEHGTITPRMAVTDDPVLVLDGGRTRVRDADRKGKGVMLLEDAIAQSRNVVAAKIALGLGADVKASSAALYETWRALGFGERTGIDLAAEAAGLVRDPAVSAWREIDLANGAFGQGIAVTPIQLARAYAAMVNGGRLVTPHVVAAVGEHAATFPEAPQVIAAEHVPTLTWMMNHVVTSVKQYAAGALVPDHFVGGKTGTAQIWDAEAGAFKDSTYHFSFVGYIGRRVGQPELIVAVRITELRPTVLSAGVYEMPIKSWELFRRVASDAIAIPGLLPELSPDEPSVAVRG